MHTNHREPKTAHERMKVKLLQILQTAELHIEKQREVKAPRGRPAAAAGSSASLYDDDSESASQVLEDSESDEEARSLRRSP